jgi:hypothetical protein
MISPSLPAPPLGQARDAYTDYHQENEFGRADGLGSIFAPSKGRDVTPKLQTGWHMAA